MIKIYFTPKMSHHVFRHTDLLYNSSENYYSYFVNIGGTWSKQISWLKFCNKRSGIHSDHCTKKLVNSRSSPHSTQVDNPRWHAQVRNLYRKPGFIVIVKYRRLQRLGSEKEFTQNLCGENTGGYNEQWLGVKECT